MQIVGETPFVLQEEIRKHMAQDLLPQQWRPEISAPHTSQMDAT